MSTTFWVYGLSSGQKKVILENFKSQQYELLFESDIELLDQNSSDILWISKKLSIYDTIISNVSDSRKQAEEKKENISQVISSLESTLASLDTQIQASTDSIKQVNNSIILVKKQIEESKQEMFQLKQKIEASNEVLLEYMVYIYKKSNTIYEWNDIDNLKSILLNGDDIWWIIDTLEKNESSLKSLRKSEIIERSILKDKQAFKQRLLEASKWKQTEYEKFIASKIDLERSVKIKAVQQKIKFKNLQNSLLEQHGCSFVDVSKNSVELRTLSEKCLNLNKIIYSESQLTEISQLDGNFFSWPVIPSRWISAYFRDHWYRSEFWDDHDAIDLPINQGTPIRAPMSGYVIHVEPPVSDGYAFVAIKHPEGFVSVYWHVSQVAVEQFDFVKKWQVFAMSGGEYGTPWAWYLTTGPHLHFELFRDKEYVDPLNFLDLSILSLEELDEKYRYKYYGDFKKRKWYEYVETQDDKNKRFRIIWETEIERQKYLLNTYARSDFRNWETWVSESLDAGVDPTFVMCIGLAESWLWANLTTDFNVWNVGNTDGWDRKKFPNPRSWIYAIVRTLNNKFLGHHTTVDKLSCYGNSEAKLCDSKKPIGEFVYASSSDHWHNNIIKCMSHVKWIYVSDDYKFRLD